MSITNLPGNGGSVQQSDNDAHISAHMYIYAVTTRGGKCAVNYAPAGPYLTDDKHTERASDKEAVCCKAGEIFHHAHAKDCRGSDEQDCRDCESRADSITESSHENTGKDGPRNGRNPAVETDKS